MRVRLKLKLLTNRVNVKLFSTLNLKNNKKAEKEGEKTAEDFEVKQIFAFLLHPWHLLHSSRTGQIITLTAKTQRA